MSGELQCDATFSILETVQQEGKREVKRKLEYYNLDAVISVGYRVNSTQATQFRIWATQLIKDYIIKGFAMDDERLKNAPSGRVLKSDTTIAKNYLSEDEIKKLERTVSAFFDYIEGIIERRNTFTMEAFAESVNKFLAFNEYQVLEGYGQVSRQAAEQKAHIEYEQFNKQQKIESDFDREVKQLLSNKKRT